MCDRNGEQEGPDSDSLTRVFYASFEIGGQLTLMDDIQDGEVSAVKMN